MVVYFGTATKPRSRGVLWSIIAPPFIPTTSGKEDESTHGAEANWVRITTLSVFERHAWIESSEAIEDKLLVSLPPDQLAVRLDLRIVGQGLEWTARAIVKVDADDPAKLVIPVTDD